MKFYNQSEHYVRVKIFNGFPHTEKNLVASLNDYGPNSEASHDLDPGDYYVYISTTNIGPNPPGITIAGSGGVPSTGVVTLTGTDRIAIA